MISDIIIAAIIAAIPSAALVIVVCLQLKAQKEHVKLLMMERKEREERVEILVNMRTIIERIFAYSHIGSSYGGPLQPKALTYLTSKIKEEKNRLENLLNNLPNRHKLFLEQFNLKSSSSGIVEAVSFMQPDKDTLVSIDKCCKKILEKLQEYQRLVSF